MALSQLVASEEVSDFPKGKSQIIRSNIPNSKKGQEKIVKAERSKSKHI